jgi:hypothetical protein
MTVSFKLALTICGTLVLGSTARVPGAACADERDTITTEYATFSVNLTPKCTDYTQSARSEYFSHAELTTKNPHAWALIRGPLTVAKTSGYGLDKWRQAYGSARTMNSAYRCPHHNAEIGGAAQSRHMYGDAADLANATQSQAEYNAMHAAAVTAKADYIEPVSGPCGLDCVHADWRDHAGPYTSAASPQTQPSATTLTGLDSPDEKTRIAAFYKLLAAAQLPGTPGASAAVQRIIRDNPAIAPQLREILIANLARENATVRAATAPKQLTETYVTYYGDLIGAVAGLRDVRAVTALVGAIDTGAMAQEGLAALGAPAVGPVAAQLSDAAETRRYSAAVVLGLLAGNENVKRDPAALAAVRDALQRASKDSSARVRAAASASLSRVGR